MAGITRYGSYVPFSRVQRSAFLGGRGARAVASHDEDSVSMAVEAARDVVQATLGKAMRGLAGFRGESGLFTWICRICRNEVVEHLRARNRGKHVVLMDDHASLRAAVTSSPPGPPAGRRWRW